MPVSVLLVEKNEKIEFCPDFDKVAHLDDIKLYLDRITQSKQHTVFLLGFEQG